jgi:UDP-N-acetylglucosamine--N-acetylmuramyl-(pentapeptide) pyrophosphoryl-undecaprenol N-acetylglucosamine transferase
MSFKVIIAGGGTGGHLFPAVAVGEALACTRSDTEVLFVGASNGMEARWFPLSGLRFELLNVHGFAGKSPLARLHALSDFLRALSRARRIHRRFGPDVVVSAGGYASAPITVAAIISGTPVVLMEQNTQPGLANRMLWRFANKICLGFTDAVQAFDPAKVEVTGNPVRFSKMPRAARQPAGRLQILVLGGSSGAHRLNLGVLGAIKILNEGATHFAITHQTGDADVLPVTDAYRALGHEANVISFIKDIATALDAADLIIARAGAMTVSEIALAGRAAILVPYPFHRDHQQQRNAMVLARVGAAEIVADDAELAQNLADLLKRFSSRPELLQEMAGLARQVARDDAAERIARVCLEVAGNGASCNRNPANPPSALGKGSGGHESKEQCVTGGTLSDG